MLYTLLIIVLPMLLIIGLVFVNYWSDGISFFTTIGGFITFLITAFISTIVVGNLSLLVSNSRITRTSNDQIIPLTENLKFGIANNELFENDVFAIENEEGTKVIVINKESGKSYKYAEGDYILVFADDMEPGVYGADVERTTKVWFFKSYDKVGTAEINVIVIPSSGHKVANVENLTYDKSVVVGLDYDWMILLPVAILIFNTLLCFVIETFTLSTLVFGDWGAEGPLWLIEVGLLISVIYTFGLVMVSLSLNIL